MFLWQKYSVEIQLLLWISVLATVSTFLLDGLEGARGPGQEIEILFIEDTVLGLQNPAVIPVCCFA